MDNSASATQAQSIALEPLAAAPPVRAALSGFADAHAYAEHVAATTQAAVRSDVQKAVSDIRSHVGAAVLIAAATGAVLAAGVVELLPRVLGH